MKKRQVKPTLPQNMLFCPKLSKGPSDQKVFFLEFIGRGEVGQIMTKADEGGKGGLKTPEIG